MAMLYALNLTPWQSHGAWRELLPGLPQARQQRALRCRSEAGGARVAGGGWLLQYALTQAGVPAQAQRFTENPWGKPMLADRDGPQFSLSHSGPWAVCAVGQWPLGVDVERPRCTMAVARRFFHPLELEELEALPPAERQDRLCRLWTGKEAFVKALGRGLTLPLDSFQIALSSEDAVLRQTHTDLPYRLHEYRLDLCRAALCTTEARPPLQSIAIP